jgi:hypothetical protein
MAQNEQDDGCWGILTRIQLALDRVHRWSLYSLKIAPGMIRFYPESRYRTVAQRLYEQQKAHLALHELDEF